MGETNFYTSLLGSPLTGGRPQGSSTSTPSSHISSSLVLAELFDSLLSGDGHRQTIFSAGVREQDGSLRRAYDRAGESQRGALSRLLPSETLQELLALSTETDAGMFFEGLTSLGIRLNQNHRSDLAMAILASVQQTLGQDFPGRPANHAALGARAGRELDAILGRGAIGARVEHLGRGLAQEASNPVMLASMGVAGFAFSTVRMGMLSRLLASSSEGFFFRGFGARALASTVGFVAEVPAFVFSGRGLNEALGVHQDWSLNAVGHELATAGITLSTLKLSGAGARSVLGRMEGNSAFERMSRAALPQFAMLGGVMAGHRLEETVGLRRHVDGATTFVDSLSTLLQFHVSGRLLNHAMGADYARFQQELEYRSEVMGRMPRAQPPSGDRPPIAELLQGMFSLHRPVAAGVGTVEGREGGELRLPHVFMMENDGDGKGGRDSNPPSGGLAPTLIRPLAPRPLTEAETAELGRADTIMRQVDITPAARPTAEGTEVEAEVDGQETGVYQGGAVLKAPAVPRLGHPETQIEVSPGNANETGVYDPQLLREQMLAAQAAPIDPFNLVPGTPVGPKGRYSVLRRLGGGGMGDVWEVTDTRLGRPAVIKVPKAGLFTPDDLRRFDREISIGANLNDRFVVSVYDVIELTPTLRVPVMKYVPGRDLHTIRYYLDVENPEMRASFPAEARLDIFAKICEALDSIHEDGIVHRDLKPANIRVTDGDVLLMDFGLAKRGGNGNGSVGASGDENGSHDSDAPKSRLSIPVRDLQSANITQSGVFQGTPGYIAPETVFTNPIVNFRSPDIFAMGVILYEWMTGNHPFATYRDGDPALGETARVPERDGNGMTVVNINNAILWAEPSLAAKIVPPTFREVTGSAEPEFYYNLEEVARRAFHPDPGQRYQTAAELRQAALLARSRSQRTQLDRIRTEMAGLEKSLQETWSNFSVGTRIDPIQWENMQRPIQELRYKRAQWRRGYDDLVTSVIQFTKGEPLVEARKFIAEAAWQRLIEGGDRMEQVVRESLRNQVLQYDLATAEDPHASMKAALRGSVALELSMIEPGSGVAVQGGRLRIIPIERETDRSGRELNTFRLGDPLIDGDIDPIRDQISLPAGNFVFEFSHPEFEPMRVPVRIGLQNVREGILRQSPYRLEFQFVHRDPNRSEMVVVHGGKATLGHDYYHDGPPTNVYAPPMREKFIPTFLISRSPIVIGPPLRDAQGQASGNGYRAFIESLLEEGRYPEALQYL
ncbi:MAG: serine/threonine protein kinase, partial [Deltaproteobacteria bacterium]|nr:serine/threonine protein kinase [Deltaproteobacteria bacterium]